MSQWRNWSRTATADPETIIAPRTEQELSAAMLAARETGANIKAVGSGHSFTDCATTTGTIVQLREFDTVEWVGPAAPDGSRLVRVGAGITLARLCEELAARGLALANMGDINKQTISGAISTGTHGTGIDFTGFAGMVEEVRLVTADGQVRTANAERHPELFQAARLSIGVLGVITAITLRAVPAFTLHAHEAPRPLAEVLESLNDPSGPVHTNDHFEFYWFPRTDIALTKANNRVAGHDQPLATWRRLLDDEILSNGLFTATNNLVRLAPKLTTPVNFVASRALTERAYTAASHDVFVTPRRVRFREMEYAIPIEAVPAALTEVRKWLKSSGVAVPFPIEVRFVSADDVWLSTAYGRRSGYIAVHQFIGMEYREYFGAVAQIMAQFGGRPHWGKMHWLRSEHLRELYPKFDDFLAVRDRVDPAGVFANRYTRRVFGR